MHSGDYESDGRTQEELRRRQAEAASRRQQEILQREKEMRELDAKNRRK